ncbi:hypothetical protein [Brevundimonas sp. A19_0]|uniref:hypothetical protein n=1 Tax=Brevundimonas sp. A19_0 TaxID=2821087 RepID=UPI001ADA59A2|nr:hypothetical protein [Brevundimonas sp. A19_0]MBO9501076.1 hypothetical protein [Brevundimonas sp. A19_0]
MRLTLAIAAALAIPALMPDAAQAQERPPAYTNAEACLRERAADAVAVSSGATDAAEFLLGYLCAETVGYAAAYEQNTASLLAMSDMASGMGQITAQGGGTKTGENPFDFSTMFGGLKVDPVTGALVSDPDAEGGFMNGTLKAQAAQMSALFGDRPPVFLRVLAGELVVQHRH